MYRYEKKSLLFRVSLKKLVAELEKHPLINATISFKTVHNSQIFQVQKGFCVARPSVSQNTPVPEVLDMQINRISAAQAMDQAIACGHKEDFDGALKSLKEASDKIESSSTGITEFCKGLTQDLKNCMQTMKEKLTFATGVHVANAYSSMHYAERSSGAYLDNNNNNSQKVKSLLSKTEYSSSKLVNPTSYLLNRYQTFDQAEESKKAQLISYTYLSNY